MKKLALVFVLCAVMLFGITACSGGGSNETQAEPPQVEVFDLHVGINYESNFIFSKYDIDVLVDDRAIGNVKQGDAFVETAQVEKGAHKLTIRKSGASKPVSTIDLNVEEELYYECSVKAHSDSLDIKDQALETASARSARLAEEKAKEDQEKAEKEAAEKKAAEEAAAAEEKAAKEKAEAEQKAAEEKAAAEKKAAEEKAAAEKKAAALAAKKQALEKAFPKKNAVKALVVALTNGMADDVFASDGNTLDTSKFHSYSDRSGFYLVIEDEGAWSYKDKDTWHVKGMEFHNNLETPITASADVSFDGKNYRVSNLKGLIGRDEDYGVQLDEFEKESQSSTYLKVPQKLLK